MNSLWGTNYLYIMLGGLFFKRLISYIQHLRTSISSYRPTKTHQIMWALRVAKSIKRGFLALGKETGGPHSLSHHQPCIRSSPEKGRILWIMLAPYKAYIQPNQCEAKLMYYKYKHFKQRILNRNNTVKICIKKTYKAKQDWFHWLTFMCPQQLLK